jgi:DNA polymerase-3 subunit alpha
MLFTLPQFIARKRGIEPVQYALPIVEEILKETRGIFVYDEQVMLLCQRIACFTPAESKILIRALYRKSPILGELKRKFINQGLQNGYEEEALNSVWNDISENAHFVFSKSHAVCYTWLAYQAVYLKAHFPDAFQKAVGMYA